MPQHDDESRFDVRIVRRHLRKGIVTEKEYANFLKALPDDSEAATETETCFMDSQSDDETSADDNQ